jgi:YidC/Oxa1 family membrane protein insertase
VTLLDTTRPSTYPELRQGGRFRLVLLPDQADLLRARFLYRLLGNFGLAIMVFTVFVKALFFPLANYSYKLDEQDEAAGAEDDGAAGAATRTTRPSCSQEMMALYRAEKVNPASGCLPMVVQIPVFFSLYKVIFVTIEMRQAPFFGWIHDLSATDPTNVFNLFGLIPFDPDAADLAASCISAPGR